MFQSLTKAGSGKKEVVFEENDWHDTVIGKFLQEQNNVVDWQFIMQKWVDTNQKSSYRMVECTDFMKKNHFRIRHPVSEPLKENLDLTHLSEKRPVK